MCNHTGIKSRHPRFNVDGLPIEIFATDQPGEAYVVTEPATHPVGYLFRRFNSCEMTCDAIDEDLTRADLKSMELLSPGKAPKVGTDLGDALWAMMMGLVGASTLAGRPLDEGFHHDEPKPKKKPPTRSRSKSIRY